MKVKTDTNGGNGAYQLRKKLTDERKGRKARYLHNSAGQKVYGGKKPPLKK